MEYRKIDDNYYIRMDRGDEIISNLLEICEKESIPSAVFSGIGGCQSAVSSKRFNSGRSFFVPVIFSLKMRSQPTS